MEGKFIGLLPNVRSLCRNNLGSLDRAKLPSGLGHALKALFIGTAAVNARFEQSKKII